MESKKAAPLSVNALLPLASQFEQLQPLIAALPDLNFSIPHMNMTRFTARYLCGGTSLKEGRKVSRKRLSIAMAGVRNEDVLAESIAQRIERYEVALKISRKQQMSIELLCDLHELLSPEVKLRGQIRSHQNWLGKEGIESASIITPPPEKVKPLLAEWEDFVKQHHLHDNTAALLAFSYFIVLHPFADGNGRLSRLLYTHFLLGEESYTSFLSPVLYRLNHFEESKVELFATPRAMLDGDWSNVIAYWKRAFEWQNAISVDITQKVLAVRTRLENMLLLVAKPKLATSLLDLLFEQPLVTLEYACKQLSISVSTANDLLESFCQLGLLKRFSLKQPLGTLVFSCEPIFQLWASIDDMFFSADPFTLPSHNADVEKA
ncbi:Fic family protein [Flocculibacter collagenilyticus]|uniref:Fic family protein n=1 Tax=Flocculibacter collagenilyticus TaxID=2744479 RepID=UPI0018F3E320|nr:Fic family protein [Flocculibacter collagenilyticus]